MKQLFIIAIIISTLFVIGCTTENNEGLALCLAENGVAMYGTESCMHCNEQKYLFGDAFMYVPYVDCQVTPDQCTKARITGYPTWVRADGETLVGRQDLSELAEWAGCA